MLMKVCPICNGDGFYLVKPDHMYPEMNIAGARVHLSNGLTGDAMTWVSAYSYSHNWMMRPEIVSYEYDCRRCGGSGELNWHRGKSLIPA